MGTRHPTWGTFSMTDPAPDPAPSPKPDPAPHAPADPPPDSPAPEDPTAEIAKWKHFAREHEKAAKANADAARKLAEIEDAAKTQAEKDAEARAAAEARATKAETDLLRLKVASAKGIPADLADLLTGSDEAEMGAVADRLLSMRSAGTPPAGSADGGPKGTPPAPPDIDAQIAAAQAKGDVRTVIALNSQKLAAAATS